MLVHSTGFVGPEKILERDLRLRFFKVGFFFLGFLRLCFFFH